MALNNKYLRELAEQHSITTNDDSAVYDIINGYPISIFNMNSSIFISIPMASEVFQSIKDEFSQQVKGIGLGRVSNGKDLVQISVKKPKLLAQQYGELKGVIARLVSPRANELECHWCHSTGCDMAMAANQRYYAVHRHCCDAQNEQKTEMINSHEGSYILGAIGGLLGAVLVAALALGLAMALDTSYGLLFVLMSYAAVGGYRLLKGPYGTTATVVVVVCSVVAFVAYLYAGVIWQLGVYSGITVGQCLSQFAVLTRVVFNGEFLGSMWFEILFFAIGLAAVLVTRPLSRSKQLKDLEALRSLCRPLRPSDYNE